MAYGNGRYKRKGKGGNARSAMGAFFFPSEDICFDLTEGKFAVTSAFAPSPKLLSAVSASMKRDPSRWGIVIVPDANDDPTRSAEAHTWLPKLERLRRYGGIPDAVDGLICVEASASRKALSYCASHGLPRIADLSFIVSDDYLVDLPLFERLAMRAENDMRTASRAPVKSDGSVGFGEWRRQADDTEAQRGKGDEYSAGALNATELSIYLPEALADIDFLYRFANVALHETLGLPLPIVKTHAAEIASLMLDASCGIYDGEDGIARAYIAHMLEEPKWSRGVWRTPDAQPHDLCPYRVVMRRDVSADGDDRSALLYARVLPYLSGAVALWFVHCLGGNAGSDIACDIRENGSGGYGWKELKAFLMRKSEECALRDMAEAVSCGVPFEDVFPQDEDTLRRETLWTASGLSRAMTDIGVEPAYKPSAR